MSGITCADRMRPAPGGRQTNGGWSFKKKKKFKTTEVSHSRGLSFFFFSFNMIDLAQNLYIGCILCVVHFSISAKQS